ncbi:MAG: 5'-methylthioadenosine/adenosylhomocysteine nucleosidase [Ruminococcaceae bacterium]|nr:5'-methylthioadenosine/adenosylhomocysteine nucleosidase [Oscillospiraceae bacterium]
MITGIIGAMQIETDALKAMVKEPICETVSGVEFVRGYIGKQEVVVAQCGIGKVFAALCAQTMILRYGVGRIINTGVAGTLCEELGLLNVAVSTAVVEHDMDTSPLGDPVGLISGINIVQLPADKALCDLVCRAAVQLGVTCVQGVIASGDQFIADPQKKQYIHETFDAVACEMEGAAVGHVCYVNQIPFVVVRCISDNADDKAGSMDYPELCRRAAVQSQRLIEEILS